MNLISEEKKDASLKAPMNCNDSTNTLEIEEADTRPSSTNTPVPRPKDRYGFFITDNFHKVYELDPDVANKRKRKEAERTKKWVKMIKQWQKYYESEKSTKLKDRARKGIPDIVRGHVWYELSSGEVYKQMFPDLEKINIKGLDPLVVDEIERDVDRTFPRHELFCEKDSMGQAALRVLLRRYAALDKEVGYCQGMGFIAGLFLSYMSEDNAFYCFYAVLNRPATPLRLLYLPRLAETQKVLYIFENLGEMHLGGLWKHLEKEGIHPTMYLTEWLMTMFCRGFSFDLVTKVWDIFLCEGTIKIFYRVSLAIIKYFEKALLQAPFEDIMGLLRDLPRRLDAVKVMQICWSIPLKTAQIQQLESQYVVMKTLGK